MACSADMSNRSKNTETAGRALNRLDLPRITHKIDLQGSRALSRDSQRLMNNGEVRSRSAPGEVEFNLQPSKLKNKRPLDID